MADVAAFTHPEKKETSRYCFIDTDTDPILKDVGPPPSPFLGLEDYVQFEGYPAFRTSAEMYENAVYRYRIQRILPLLDQAKNLQFKSDAAKKEIYHNLSQNFDFEKSEIEKSRKYTNATVYESQPCMDSSCPIHPEDDDSSVTAEEVMRVLAKEEARFLCSEMDKKLNIDRYPAYKASVKQYNESIQEDSSRDDRWNCTSYSWMSPEARELYNQEHEIPDDVEDPMQKYEHLKGYISDLIVKYSFIFDPQNVPSSQGVVANTAPEQMKLHPNKTIDGGSSQHMMLGLRPANVQREHLSTYDEMPQLPLHLPAVYSLKQLQHGSVDGQGSADTDRGRVSSTSLPVIGHHQLPVFTTNPWSFWRIPNEHSVHQLSPTTGAQNDHSVDTREEVAYSGTALHRDGLSGNIYSKLSPGFTRVRNIMCQSQGLNIHVQRPATGGNIANRPASFTAAGGTNNRYSSPLVSDGAGKRSVIPNGCNDGLYWLAESQCYDRSGSDPESPAASIGTRGYSPHSPRSQYEDHNQRSHGEDQGFNLSPLVTNDFRHIADRLSCRESDRDYSPCPSMQSYPAETSPSRETCPRSNRNRYRRSRSRSTSLSSRSSYSHGRRHSPRDRSSRRHRSGSRDRSRTQRSRDRESRGQARTRASCYASRRPRSITRSMSPLRFTDRRGYRERSPGTRYADNGRGDHLDSHSHNNYIDRTLDKGRCGFQRSVSKEFSGSLRRECHGNSVSGDTYRSGMRARDVSVDDEGSRDRGSRDRGSRDRCNRERETRVFSSLSAYRRKGSRS